MYNVKLTEADDYRTVVLKKNNVVIDGETKLIIMINDVTEKVRFEQEMVKNKKEKERMLIL